MSNTPLLVHVVCTRTLSLRYPIYSFPGDGILENLPLIFVGKYTTTFMNDPYVVIYFLVNIDILDSIYKRNISRIINRLNNSY